MKWIAIPAVVYFGIVVVFESFLVFGQPTGEGSGVPMLVITTTDESGASHDRRAARVWSGGRLYVSANHWPRAWFRHVLRRPNVDVTRNGETKPHVAVPLSSAERAQVAAEHPHGIGFRILTGFPPRRFVRLDPVR